MLFLEIAIPSHSSEPLLSLFKRCIVSKIFDPRALSHGRGYHLFQRLGVVDPLENPEAIGHWNYLESFQIEASVRTDWVMSEDLIHELEKLLDALIQTQVFATFH